jgi:hypothetical protein
LKLHLPPKSFADAVIEDPPANGTSGANGVNGVDKSNGTNGTSNEENDRSSAQKTSVLRIVDTGTPAAKEKQDRPDFERQESQHEYTAAVCFLFFYQQKLINSYRVSTILLEVLQDTNIENLALGTAIAQMRKLTSRRRIRNPVLSMNASSPK